MRDFVRKEELERFLDSRLIKLGDARDFFKSRGNIVYAGSRDAFERHMSTFILGNSTLEPLKREVKQKKYVSISGFVLKTELNLEELKDSYSDVREDIKPEEPKLPRITNMISSEEKLKGRFGYHRTRTSQVNIFDTEFSEFDFRIERLDVDADENVYAVYCFSSYKTSRKILRKLTKWVLDNDPRATDFEIRTVSFDKINNTEEKHQLLVDVIDDVTEYELNGINKWNAEEADDLTSENPSDMFSKDVQDVGAKTRTVSAEELTDSLEEIGKSCYRISLTYWNENPEEGVRFDIEDEGNLKVELAGIRDIEDISEVETLSDFQQNDKVIGDYTEEQRRDVTADYYLSMVEAIFEEIIS